MRFLCFIILLIVTIIEVGPIPMTPLLLLWVIAFRPMWFYDLVMRIYASKLVRHPGGKH